MPLTYLRRRGRMTKGQRRALETLGSKCVISAATLSESTPVQLANQFGSNAKTGLEIGFGMGHALVHWAQRAADWNLYGIEVYQPGIGALLLGLEQHSLNNVRVIECDAQSAISELFDGESLDEIRIFFPDPWPKKRHHKRRLIQPDFVELITSRLVGNGRLLLATDWQPYARWMLEVLESQAGLVNTVGAGYAPRSNARPITRFEARGERLGHDVWDLSYRKVCPGES